jgi:hypothetical protein
MIDRYKPEITAALPPRDSKPRPKRRPKATAQKQARDLLIKFNRALLPNAFDELTPGMNGKGEIE